MFTCINFDKIDKNDKKLQLALFIRLYILLIRLIIVLLNQVYCINKILEQFIHKLTNVL